MKISIIQRVDLSAQISLQMSDKTFKDYNIIVDYS